MPQIAKPAAILKLTNDVSHRTKREIAIREAAEKGTLTGEGMTESEDVKAVPEAHKEFLRLRKLFRKIEKDDAIYEQVINRYCLLHAECLAIAGRKQKLEAAADQAEDPKDVIELYKLVNACDAELMRKRKMMGEIEDKNLMNIQSALRSIPKKPDAAKNPLKEALSG